MAMTCWVALLRGINVGGHHILPMQALRSLLEDLGSRQVATYIQSGNAVFCHDESDADELSKIISDAIDRQFGFRPQVLLLTQAQLTRAVVANPYAGTGHEPKTMHLSFLAEKANTPDLDGLEALRSDTEAFTLADDVFYLYAPDGIGRSKLAAKVEKLLGVPITARNWRTVNKVLDMARACR